VARAGKPALSEAEGPPVPPILLEASKNEARAAFSAARAGFLPSGALPG
jgi:hypothetical protein